MAKRQDYDYLIKLLLIGDSGGCCCIAHRSRTHAPLLAAASLPLHACLPLQVWARAACCCALQRTASHPASSPPSGRRSGAVPAACVLPPGAAALARPPSCLLASCVRAATTCLAPPVVQHRLQDQEGADRRQMGEAADLGHGACGQRGRSGPGHVERVTCDRRHWPRFRLHAVCAELQRQLVMLWWTPLAASELMAYCPCPSRCLAHRLVRNASAPSLAVRSVVGSLLS